MTPKKFSARRSSSQLRRNTIYLLPNLFTTAALFCGFFAIVKAMNDDFYFSVLAIFLSTIFDNLDGRVARLTHTQSSFGAEYDSLSDMICFGVAPALVMYEWTLKSLGAAGWAASFIYCVTAALRLARFNILSHDDDESQRSVPNAYFVGMPTPIAALTLMSYLYVIKNHEFLAPGYELSLISWILTILIGILMISNFSFYSAKDINFRKRIPFSRVIWIVFAVLAFAQPFFDFFDFLFLLCMIYIVWGSVKSLSDYFLLPKKEDFDFSREDDA